jgi:hypothetical protein
MTEKQLGIPLVELMRVSLEVSAPVAADNLSILVGKAGWARFQTGVLLTETLSSGQVRNHGQLTYAEWIDGSISHRLFRDAAGTLRHVQFAEGSGEAFERQQVTVYAHRPATGRLRYNIYWRDGADGAFDRAFDVFAGFVGDR